MVSPTLAYGRKHQSGQNWITLIALIVFHAGALAALWPAYLVLRRNPVDALRHS